ncbi:hypothetical protein B9Z39_14770, partial [Limnohabitans sp. JirII-29]|uniref:beta strand repeat-containing protein n=1 Tax=Limnohabitans sp. JirII-29 TaxID=1835756 RepID=UPI000D35C1DB
MPTLTFETPVASSAFEFRDAAPVVIFGLIFFAAGHSSNGATSTPTIDTTAPTATLGSSSVVANTASATVSSSEVGTAYLVNSSVSVTSLADITSQADGLWNSVAIGQSNTSTALGLSGLSDGSYVLYTVDAVGNLSAATTQTITLDSTAPTAVLTPGIFADTTSSASVSSSEVGTAYLVSSSVSVSSLADITSQADGLWNSVAVGQSNTDTDLSLSGLSDGNYVLYTVDAAGNLSAASSQTITLDSTAPTATLGSSNVVANTASATVSSSEVGTAYLVNSSVSVSSLADITSQADGLWNSVAIGQSNTSTALGLSGLSDGSYVLYTVDAAGNLSAATTQTITLDSTAPTATLGSSSVVANTASATVSSSEVGTAYLVNSSVSVTSLADITSQADGLWNSVAIGQSNTSTALGLSGLSDGSYVLYTVDAAGNLSAATTQTITLDSTAPTATLTAGSLTNTASATVSSSEVGTAYLVNSSVSVSTLADITSQADGLWNSVAIGQSDTSTALGLSGLSDGSYVLYTVDAVGNLSAASSQGLTVTGVDLSAVAAGTGGFVINGQASGDRSGWSVSAAGDVNGDGLADLLVAAPNSSSAGNNAGTAYVVFGSTSSSTIELSDVAAGTGGFAIDGQAINDNIGNSVSSAGDVNGDGLADLLVGAPNIDYSAGNDAGRSYVVFGTTATSVIQLSTVAAGSGGFVINGECADDQSGYSVSGAGDVNGDGLTDLLLGAPFSSNSAGSSAGRSYVVWGTTATSAIELSDVAAGTGGFVINGQTSNDLSGVSVASAGDVNGDGLADLLVSAPYSSTSAGSTAGRSYVVFGTTASNAIQLSDVTQGTGGFVIDGACADDRSGVSVSGAGDVNGDGLADLLVGAIFGDPSARNNAGRSYLVWGTTAASAIALSNVAAGTGGFVINGICAGDASGYSVSGEGDVNGDGLADLLVSAPYSSTSSGNTAGHTYLVLGTTSTSTIELSNIAAGTGGFVINGACASDQSGFSVSGAGDVNGDGLADLLVGAPYSSTSAGSNTGRSYVIFGATDGTWANKTAVDQLGSAAADTLTG